MCNICSGIILTKNVYLLSKKSMFIFKAESSSMYLIKRTRARDRYLSSGPSIAKHSDHVADTYENPSESIKGKE